jgi:hypothetical protein
VNLLLNPILRIPTGTASKTAGGYGISPTNNPDFDTHNNLEEFIVGSDPTNGVSYFAFTNAAPSPTGFIVEWNPCISNRFYNVYWTTNLTEGFQPLEMDIAYPRNSCTDTVHSAASQCFYRVDVQLPDSHPFSQIHYVDINNATPALPYTSWQTAATNIQDAIDATIDGDTVLVADGHYLLTSEIVVTNAITVQSHNGPDITIVDGDGSTGCFLLGTNTCVISGFIVTNANDVFGVRGISVRSFGSWNPVVTNCIITGNHGGGMFSGTAIDCMFIGNSAGGSGLPGLGGGINSTRAINCTIVSNSATDFGGGAAFGELINCTIHANVASNNGGGVYQCMGANCVISGNVSLANGGGMYMGTATNCLIIGNTAATDGGGAHYSTLINCTVSDNLATNNGGGISAGTGLGDGIAINSIIYYNTALNTGDDWSGNGTIIYCCSAADWAAISAGCLTNAPLFINRANRNYRLSPTSPCISSGLNSFAATAPDLNESPRIFDFVIDMGAYEFQGLLDADADGMSDGYETYYFGNKTNAMATGNVDLDLHNNLQEYIAGTDPTNGLSHFRFTNVAPATTGFSVEWEPSIGDRLYNVSWSTNLTEIFHPLETGIEYPQNSYTDTLHAAVNQCFYTIEVQLK